MPLAPPPLFEKCELWELNSNPHARKGSTLLMEQPLLLGLFFFLSVGHQNQDLMHAGSVLYHRVIVPPETSYFASLLDMT